MLSLTFTLYTTCCIDLHAYHIQMAPAYSNDTIIRSTCIIGLFNYLIGIKESLCNAKESTCSMSILTPWYEQAYFTVKNINDVENYVESNQQILHQDMTKA